MRSLSVTASVAFALFAHLTACASSPPAAPAAPPAPSASAKPAEASEPFVDVPTAKKLVADGAKLVDVRSPEEYATKHIEGAENVPVDTIADKDLGPKDAPIVLYCGSGKRAARATEALRAKGYTNVHNLGGMKRWDE